VLAAVLVGAAIIPGHAVGSVSSPCQGTRCGRQAGTVRWIRPLPGSWTVDGPDGTVLSHGETYAAAGGGLAAVGLGLTIRAYDGRTGSPLWSTMLSGFPAGSSVVSVRAWPGVITAGVAVPVPGPAADTREEIVLAARTGDVVREYPAAMYGGAVAATAARVVIVGPSSVTCYDNVTGTVVWSRPTGTVAQAWRVDQGEIYVTQAAGGYLGTAPVTALLRISLQTGTEQLIKTARAPFAGTLSGAYDGVALFSGSRGLSAYSAQSGRLLWRRPGVVPETVDPVRQVLYVTSGSALIGIRPLTGARVKNASVRGSSGLYGVRDGVALGLDDGARGVAWGYAIARQHVVWTTPPLPWPHYFVDLSGIGGSADPASSIVLLASCAALSSGPASASGRQACTRPELVAIRS
jgi:outer membrane protein assembly factor BamB